MRSTAPFSLTLLLVASCSALVQIDDDKYLGGGASLGDGGGDGDTGGGLGDGDFGGGPGDGDGNSGGSGDGDGDEPSGGMGGDGAGGSGGVGTGGVGTGGVGTGGVGTGGVGTGGEGTGGTLIEIPDPVHYYPLDGDTDDQGTGDFLPATVTGNVIWYETTGLSGGSLEIPGTNGDYLSLDPAVGNTNPFTISWWFISSRDGYITLAHRIPTPQSADSWELILDTDRPRLKLSGVEYDLNYEFPLKSDGVWTHVVYAFHANPSGTMDLFKVWVNGTIVLDRTLVLDTSAIVTGEGIVFGRTVGGTDPFWGLIDEIRVYDSFLNDEEVEALYLYDAP